jgi:hypothetical protein
MDIKKIIPTPAEEVEAYVASLFGNLATTTPDTSSGSICRWFRLAASGSATWHTEADVIFRKVTGSTVQFCLTQGTLNYTQIAALGTGTELGNNQIICFVSNNNAEALDLNVFVPKGRQVTLSVSSSGTCTLQVFYDLVRLT